MSIAINIGSHSATSVFLFAATADKRCTQTLLPFRRNTRSRLNEPESRFHISLVSNVLDLMNLLPQLNVGEDPELNRFAGEIRNKLCSFTARDLKTNDVLRVTTANDAAALLYEMDAVLREREQRQDSASEVDSSADQIVSYMEAASQ